MAGRRPANHPPAKTGAEHRHAVGRILAGRHYGRIPGLVGKVDRSLQQGIESCAR